MKKSKRVTQKDDTLNIRLSTADDVKIVLDEINNGSSGPGYYKAVFGPFNVANLIDFSTLSLVAETFVPRDNDYQSEFRGFLCLDDNVSCMGDQQYFEPVLDILKNYVGVTPYNTLFVNFWHMEEKPSVAFTLIREAFAQLPSLEYIFWVCPLTFIVANYIDEMFQDFDYFKTDNDQLIATCKEQFRGLKILYLNRSDFLAKLSVRNARIEDNDELIPIIQRSNPEILADGDRYLLADLLLKQDSNNRFFVGLDKRDRIQGMLATSLDVNMSLIMKIFDIDAYPDLIIQADTVPPPPPLLIGILGDIRLIEIKNLETFLYNQNVLFINFQFIKDDLEDLYHDLKDNSVGSNSNNNNGFNENLFENKSILFKYCQLLISRNPNPSALQGIVILNFPRTEDEAISYSSTLIKDFDILIELLDDSEDVDEEEEENLQHHLDGIEVLRENYFKDQSDSAYINQITTFKPGASHSATSDAESIYYRKTSKSNWIKVPLSKDNSPVINNDRLHLTLSNCFDERVQRLEAAKAINKEKPPRANAFAITALCVDEDYLSRSLDLIKLAFEEQSNLSYCLYMLSNDTIPSIALKGFNYIKTRPGISFDQSLYIIHRAFFYLEEYLTFQRVTERDLPSASINNGNKVSESKRAEGKDQYDDENNKPNYDLYDFLSNIKLQTERSEVLDTLELSLRMSDIDVTENPDDISFKIMLSNKIIGLIVLSKRMLSIDDVNWYRCHYHLDDFINYQRNRLRNSYSILYFCIDPIFSAYTKVILQQIMRKTLKNTFYYHHEKDAIPSKEIVENFLFIKPRRFPDGKHINNSSRPELKHPTTLELLSLPQENCPLYLVTKGSLSHYKKIISKRIVIIGGSVHSYAFLETLCSIHYLYLPNIYFIIDILPTSFRLNTEIAGNYSILTNSMFSIPSKYSDQWKFDIEQNGCLSVQDIDLPYLSEQWAMGYAYRINIIKGRLTDIDRENKAIVVSDELVIEYDYLLLSTWTQDTSARRIPALQGVHPSKCADAGIFSLGNPAADLLAINWVRKRAQNRNEPIIICGAALKVFTAAESLLRAGIDPNKIVCLIHELEENIEGCQELTQMALISQSPVLAGIKQVYWKCRVSDVTLSRTGFIHSVEIHDLRNGSNPVSAPGSVHSNSNNNNEDEKSVDPNAIPNHLSCIALMLCGGREFQSCERDIFAAINDCGLVFDGGLVVDKNFQTVDPRIYAISDYTKFSRIFRDELPHYKYNPRELGTYVAMQFLFRHLDPIAQQYVSDLLYLKKLENYQPSHINKNHILNSDVKNKVVKFVLPRGQLALLPGDLVQFSCGLPKVSNDTVSFLTDNAVSMNQQFGPAPPRRITTLKFDAAGTVTEINYVGLDFVEFRNLSQIPGYHESLLNNAIHAHRKDVVEDWVEFFRKDWTTAIFLHSFPKLISSLRVNLQSDKGMLMLLNRIFDKMQNTVEDSEVTEFRRTVLGPYGELIPELTKKLVYTETYEWIKENRDFVPKFYIHQQQNN